MAYIIKDPSIPPLVEPVSLADVKTFVGVPSADTNSDALLDVLIAGAREYAEGFCGQSFCRKGYIQTLDSYPYFIDTIVSQQAYPPSYYTAPRYSTTLWNYSQMIKLSYGPLLEVSTLRYVDSASGLWKTLVGTVDMSNPNGADFLGDVFSMPPRLFPAAGSFWPPVKYVPNSVEIHYVSGAGGPTPTAAVASQSAGGSLAARTYYIRLTYVCGTQELAGSREVSFAASANNLVSVASPASNFIATGYNVYAATASGSEKLQNSSPIAIGTNWIEPNSGLTSTGAAPPTDDSFVPASVKAAIKMLAAYWFEHRDEPRAPGADIPMGAEALLWMNTVMDMAPTRG